MELATDRERSATPSTELLLPVQEIKWACQTTTSNDRSIPYFVCRDVAPRRSLCFSLMVWLCAPLLLSVVSAFTFPAFAVLAMLLLCMKVSMHVFTCQHALAYMQICTHVSLQPYCQQMQ